MSVQTTYYDFPGIGFPGQLADINNSVVTKSLPAETDIPVGVGVAYGTAITDTNTQDEAYVTLPTSTGDTLLGISVRTAACEGEPINTAASVATYRQYDQLTYLIRGAIYIRLAKAVAANNTQVYVVADAGSSYNLGTLLPDNDSGNAAALTGAFFEKATAINEIVKVTIR
jgi:hypothetical protein